MKNKNNINIYFKAGILAFVLVISFASNLTIANPTISNIYEAANFVSDQLSINKDEVLIYVWSPVSEDVEVLSTKGHVMDIYESGYVIYIDLHPRANLFHPVKYVFLSESTNDLIIKDSTYPPKNFADYQMIETTMGQLLLSAQNKRANIPKNINLPLTTSKSDSRYAVLLNGGYDSGNNHVRYWNDLSNIYIALTYVYGYPDENIIVLCSDGLNTAPDQSNGQNSDPDLDGDGDDDIMYSCVLSNVDMVFEELADILTTGNELFIFQTDHGNTNGGWNTLFNLWNYEELTDAHFASLLDLLPDCEIVCTFEPCFSGGFLDNIVVPPGPIVASSACRHDEYSWAMNDLIYDEYAFYWTAAVAGEDAYGNPADADYNQDGIVTMDEAFIYAEAHDTQSESPQYDDYPENIGSTISLWPGSEPPETPTKPSGPQEWIQHQEATFSSSTTEPDGESVYYMFNWGDGNLSEWVGPYASGKAGSASHNWSELGDYEIKAVAKDINGVQSNWSEPSTLSIVENQPPETPTMTGPKIAFAGKILEFTVVAVDPDGHDINFYIYWGDDSSEPWSGPYKSGEEVKFTHTFTKSGSFGIITKAKDVLLGASPQYQFNIRIIKSKAAENQLMLRILDYIKNNFPRIYQIMNALM